MDFFTTYSQQPNEFVGTKPRPEIYRKSSPPENGVFRFDLPFHRWSTKKKRWVNNYKVKYTVWGDKGPLVLMLHGVPSNRHMYFPLQELLSSFCRTISIDMLGMGESTHAQKYGKHVDRKWLYEFLDEYGISRGDYEDIMEPWDWINDIFYIDMLMKDEFGDEQFVFVADDWGSGINTKYAEYLSDRLLAHIQIDPIAFDGYPVNEIQAIGRASGLDDEQFAMAMGAVDQTLVQIFKTMVHNPDDVWNQYSLRTIMKTYIDSTYTSESTSVNMGLKMKALRTLADRSAILSPGLLLPYHETENKRGVRFEKITAPSLILWGEKDNMMPAQQVYRFKHAMYNSNCEIQFIPDAGHFAATDQPKRVSECILNFLTRELGIGALGDIFLGFGGIWKGDEVYLINGLRRLFQPGVE